ncbi:MAG: dihydrodipicolinate synthase family protein [Bryobacteraceae bacterium]|nr:dihydrodipicolinate synthase family protein [Bryobacteraceae bacterium]
MLHGILPALVTPFDEAGAFLEAPFAALLDRVYQSGVDGVYVCGSTGEGLLQPLEQRMRVTEAAVRHSPAGRHVIVHVGAHRTADAVTLARHAARAGATALSSLPPAGAYSFDEVRDYYRTLAAATDLPFLVYHFPGVSAAAARVEQILDLCALPHVAGLKFTDHDLYKLSLIRGAGADVFNGYDEVLVAGLLMGASGGIGSFYNLVPELFVKLYRLAQDGCWTEARAVQARINELIAIATRYPCFPAVKTLLRWSGLECGRCLEPRRALTPAEETGLREAIARSSFADRFRP